MNSLFRTGGPHQIRQTGADRYSLTISIPNDPDGRLQRECPDKNCSPGAFKVKAGTGITEGQTRAFCPYCRREESPNGFSTADQARYARDIALGEARKGVQGLIKDALGLDSVGKRKFGGGFISMEMTYRPGQDPVIRRPASDQVRRDLICPHCGLDHSVFGLARWCPDCGEDIFLAHVDAEFAVLRTMVADISRREKLLGKRVALKDLENCLEDIVSIFEAVLRLISRQRLARNNITPEVIEVRMQQIGNAFQSPKRAQEILRRDFSLDLFGGCQDRERLRFELTFEKRHPIVHNLGIIDRKYLDRAHSAEKEGREVLVDQAELLDAMEMSMRIFRMLCGATDAAQLNTA